MTAGPANRTVTPLPKNRPTPIAPPMAIMVSCLWVSARWRPSESVTGDVFDARLVPRPGRSWSVMAGNAGRGKGQEMHVLLENFHDLVHVVASVIDVKRDSQSVKTARSDDFALRQYAQHLS